MRTVYNLKPVVAVRIVAEAVTILVCAIFPLIGYSCGYFLALPWFAKLVPLVVCVIAWPVLPFYGYITWSVITDENGLTTISLFKKTTCNWADIVSLRRRALLNQMRYVLETSSGARLNFSVWLQRSDELIQLIRGHMPDTGKHNVNLPRVFQNSLFAVAISVAQSLLGLLLAAYVWYFVFVSLIGRGSQLADRIIVIVFAVILTSIFLWRLVLVFLMPLYVEVSPAKLTLKTIFYRVELAWQQIGQLVPAPPLLPEGFLLKTKKGDFLLSTSIEACDELKEVIDAVIASPVTNSPNVGT